jgi:hypothetical protein
VRKILACRTPVLGCHVYQCKDCVAKAHFGNFPKIHFLQGALSKGLPSDVTELKSFEIYFASKGTFFPFSQRPYRKNHRRYLQPRNGKDTPGRGLAGGVFSFWGLGLSGFRLKIYHNLCYTGSSYRICRIYTLVE